MKNSNSFFALEQPAKPGLIDLARLLSIQPLTEKQQTENVDPHQYRLFWRFDRSGRSLHFLAPGTSWKSFSPDVGYGYEIKFYEETLIMAGCKHLYPFYTTNIHFSKLASTVLLVDLENEKIEQLIQSIIAELSQPTAEMRDVILSGMFKILLVYVSRHFACLAYEHRLSSDDQIYDAFIRLVLNQQRRQMSIDDYAQCLKIDRATLTRAVRKVSGFSTRYHIQQNIVRAAKQAAITSRANMKEVAFSLGFPDVAHFSKFFKNKAGLSFSDYKNTYQLI